MRGNLLADGTFTYTYNAAGRLVHAESVTATLVYTYNAAGLRVGHSGPSGQSVDYAWDWATGVPELLSDGDALYLVGHDTLGWDDGAGWTYALPDALGSVRQAVDGAGAVVDAREWSPYGVEVGDAQPGLGFTGEWFDAEMGLQYLRARWYAVEVGRFISRDPWEGDLPDPQSLNGWAYVEGNPIQFIDPLGLRAIIPWDQYYHHWGRSLDDDDPDIVNDLGDEDDAVALGAIAKIESNFQGNPNYEGLSPELLLISSLGCMPPDVPPKKWTGR